VAFLVTVFSFLNPLVFGLKLRSLRTTSRALNISKHGKNHIETYSGIFDLNKLLQVLLQLYWRSRKILYVKPSAQFLKL